MDVEIYRAVVEGAYKILGYISRKNELNKKILDHGDIHEITRHATWWKGNMTELKIYSAMFPYGYVPVGTWFNQVNMKGVTENSTLAIAHIPHEKDANAMAIIHIVPVEDEIDWDLRAKG